MTTWSERELRAHQPGRVERETGVLVSDEGSGWVGWLLFAGTMLILLGAFQAILGLVALFDDGYFVRNRAGQLVVMDYTTWGWIHLALAVIAVGTGTGLLFGVKLARVIAVILCIVNVIASFTFLDTSPWWGTMLIAFSVLTAYAIIAHGGEVEDFPQSG